MKSLQNAHVVLLYDVFRYALHCEDFDVQTGSIWQGILDGGEVLLVDLVHVYVEA